MSDRSRLARDVAAIVIAALACPGALLGGAALGCATEGLDVECAAEGILFSPFILAGAGVVTGLLTSGWRGLALVLIGVVIGMFAILVLSAIAGNMVPFDPIEGAIATTWFAAPVAIGYAVGRVIGRIVERARA